MTQRERVERLLKERGLAGITQADFDGPTADHGLPIRRLAARIEELRRDGWIIESHKDPSKFARYVLKTTVVKPARVTCSPPMRDGGQAVRANSPEPVSEPLFTLGPYENELEWV